MTTPTPSPSPDTDEGARHLTLAWYRRVRRAQLAHARAATRSRSFFLWLGVPAVVLGFAAGSAVVADVAADHRVLIALASLVAALLTALQTFLRLDDKRIAHETAARKFGSIRRELGELGAVGPLPDATFVGTLDGIRADYDEASAGTPQVPRRIWSSQKAADRAFWPEEFGRWPEAPTRSSR